MLAKHDVVMVGYRGVDGSSVLDCPEFSKATLDDGNGVLSDASPTMMTASIRAVPSFEHEYAHHLAMGLLAPGIEFQLSQRTATRRTEIAVLLVIIGQVAERIQRTLMQCFASRQHPLFKFRAVLQKKLLQEFAAIKVNGLLQARRADGARIQARMRVACARGQVGVETRNVGRKIARGIELDFIAGNVKIRRLRGGVANRLAETKEGLAQIVARGLLGFIGPNVRSASPVDRRPIRGSRLSIRARSSRRSSPRVESRAGMPPGRWRSRPTAG